jgi:hypothetical protein
MKTCPRCFLPQLQDEEVLNSLAHDGSGYICIQCGQIESLTTLDPFRAHYLKVGLKRAQAGLYGLNEFGDPNLPRCKDGLPCTPLHCKRSIKECNHTEFKTNGNNLMEAQK